MRWAARRPSGGLRPNQSAPRGLPGPPGLRAQRSRVLAVPAPAASWSGAEPPRGRWEGAEGAEGPTWPWSVGLASLRPLSAYLAAEVALSLWESYWIPAWNQVL